MIEALGRKGWVCFCALAVIEPWSPLGRPVEPTTEEVAAAVEDEEEDDTATRSHCGHIVKVVGGFMFM